MLLLKDYQLGVSGSLASKFVFNATTIYPVPEDGLTLWIPLLVVIVFAIIILFMIVIGRRICFCCEKESTQLPIIVDDHHGANVNEVFTSSADGMPVPDTPPPTYNELARQLSYVSNISQSSSQIEIPPAYEEAVYNADVSSEFSRRRFGGIFNIPSRLRIFSRSLSSDPPQSLPSFVSQTSTGSNSCRRSTITGTANLISTSGVVECPVIGEAYCSEPSLTTLDESAVAMPSLSTTTVQDIDDTPIAFSTDSAASDEESDSGVMMMNSL